MAASLRSETTAPVLLLTIFTRMYQLVLSSRLGTWAQ